MRRKLQPTFFSIVLILCLVIGGLGNLQRSTGLAILLVAAILFCGVHLLAGQLNRLQPKKVIQGVKLGLVLMLGGQLAVLKSMPNTVYHDPFRVLAQADQMAAGHMVWSITYFWRYANNVPLAYLMSLWLRLTQPLGLSTNISIHVLSLITLDAFILLTLRTVWQLSKRPSILVGAFAFFALTPFAYTYYLQVFYSDLPAMLVLMLVFQALLSWPDATKRQRVFLGTRILLAMLVGALLKPNLIVLLPALVLLILVLAAKHKLKGTKLWLPIVLIIVGFGLSVPTGKVIDQASNYQPQTHFAFPASNWIAMGLNTNSAGRYSGKDVLRSIKLPNKSARQKDDKRIIVNRIKRLGFAGLLRLWSRKIAVFLNVNNIQHWYNGGFRTAPSWYLGHAQFWEKLTSISYTAATLVLWATLIIGLCFWRPNLNSTSQRIGLLALITALGYLAFHTLMWETESRYGQIILPLSWFVLAAIPAPPAKTQEHRLPQPLAPVSIAAALLVAMGMATNLGRGNPQNTVVAAQRSQLSVQYHARPYSMRPQTRLKQEILLNGKANYLSIQIHAGARVHVTLQNLQTKRRYHLYDAGSVYRLHHRLTAGHYEIAVTNSSGKTQAVDVVQTYRYHLANYPLFINGKSKPTSSFIFTCMQKYTKKG